MSTSSLSPALELLQLQVVSIRRYRIRVQGPRRIAVILDDITKSRRAKIVNSQTFNNEDSIIQVFEREARYFLFVPLDHGSINTVMIHIQANDKGTEME